MGPKGGLFYIKIIKTIKIVIFEKSDIWGILGVFRGGNIQNIHRGIDPDDIFDFQKLDFKNLVFRYVLTFGLYFDVREHYHHTRLEKKRILSYVHNIWVE